MKICKIKKGNSGKMRTIYVPSAEEKTVLRRLVGDLTRLAEKSCPVDVPHGFMRGRSAVTNAQSHVGHRFTLTMDLRDFFDSVTEIKLKGKVPAKILEMILIDGAAKQGLPTSPAASNIAAAAMDKAILKWIGTAKIVYTRYADDLAFSFDNEELLTVIVGKIQEIVTRCGFSVAEQKTQFYDAQNGRRIICGVAVDDQIHPTRAIKRKLRAAIHQGNQHSERGLREWMKLNPPQQRKFVAIEGSKSFSEIQSLSKLWKLGNVSPKKMPDKGPDIFIDENVIITGDPVYMLGMSTWTNGWKSCCKQPCGTHRRGCVFFSHLQGTKIAAILSAETKIHAGVERRVMVSRCLVHELRNGTKVYDRVYGFNEENKLNLTQKLRDAGYMSAKEAKTTTGDKKVVGHAPATWKVWFDSLVSHTSIANSGVWIGKKVRVVHI